MIHQLILSTIFACTNKTPEGVKTAVPPTPPENISPESPSKDSPDTVTPSPKPEQIGPIIDTTLVNAQKEHTASILVKHITNIQQSNQEINCVLLCQQTLIDSSISQGAYHIQDCSEQRVENWNAITQQGDPAIPVGEVSCVLEPKPRPRVIKGRAPLCSRTKMSIVNDVPSYFARQAQEEAISIFSFAELHQLLCTYNAPIHLRNRCIQALKEEQAHTRMTIALCEQYGGSAPTIQVPSPKEVSLVEAALHNALVGCIQETWAAVLEEYQAQHTQVHHHIQRRIAKDEAAHAQLAWDIHTFFMSQLTQNERDFILEHMNTRLSSQGVDIVESFPGSSKLGIPSADLQHRLYHEFSKHIQQRIRQAA